MKKCQKSQELYALMTYNKHHKPPSQHYFENMSSTLNGETFAGETFANFANFGLFRENLTREKFEIIHLRKFVPRNSFHFSLSNF